MNSVEICCGSYEDCMHAAAGGADRVELNSSLFLGGITPTPATVAKTVQDCAIPVICMDRPRGAGFCYSPAEADIMFADAEMMLKMGCHGIAFGFLKEDHSIQQEWTKKMIQLIHSFPDREAVFHRAIDCVNDMDASVELLIQLGADRILTSGRKNTAMEGIAEIAALQSKYGNQIQFLAGSGVNAANAQEILTRTGIHQVHSSAKTWQIDPTTQGGEVSYAYHEALDYDAVSEAKVKALVDAVKKTQH